MTDPMARLGAALADRYRLERELGQGGMATVYLAADLKHDRQVAIKVLKPDLAAVLGSERFITEIKTTAALSHPHILPLFDSGEAGGFLYYVMPYLNGETIREKLTREGQFGIAEAVKIATEVAEALDYAHQHGVIHRDIKPENILLHAGRPMVMDFGIALAVSAAAGGRMTETGLSLGTPHYMSPEQATADKEITGRSDIYSLASVLYEMLAGVPPHDGGSAQQVIMRIIADTPRPVTDLRKSVPANVAAALGQALEKLPADRFDSAKAFADALGNPGFVTAAALVAAPGAVGAAASWIRSPFSWAAIAAVVVSAGMAWNSSRPRPEPPAIRELLSLPDETVTDLDLSRDGSRLVYTTVNTLFVRDLDQTEVRRLESGFRARLSPDGRHVAFNRSNDPRVWIRPVDGGSAEARADSVLFYAWGDDGHLYASQSRGRLVLRIPPTAGVVDTIAQFDADSGRISGVEHILPGSRAAVGFRSIPGQLGGTELVFLDFKSQEVRPLGLRGWNARYLDAGFLLFLDGLSRLDARASVVRFDARSGRVLGVPAPVGSTGILLAASGNGIVIYGLPSPGRFSGVPLLMDRSGSPRALPGVDSGAVGGILSPSGTEVAYAVYRDPMAYRSSTAPQDSDVWVASLDGAPSQRRTFGGGVERVVIGWGARGETILFAEYANDSVAVMAVPANGAAPPAPAFLAARLPSSDRRPVRFSVSPDGRRLAWGSDDGLRSVVMGDTTVTLTRIEQAQSFNFKFSPDGRWVSYTSNPGAGPDIYIQSFPLAGGSIQVSDGRGYDGEGGVAAFWSRDGRSLFYTGLPDDLIEARLDLAQRRVTDRRRLFKGPAVRDVLPGDSLFWGSSGAAAFLETPLVMLVNAATEFRRLLAPP